MRRYDVKTNDGNPKTLQYLMGHSEIGVTLNVYTHVGFEDAVAEIARLDEKLRVM